MRKTNKHIPVNILPEGTCEGMMLMRELFHGPPIVAEVERAHRDGGYTFIVQEAGSTELEIDFQICKIQAPALIYIQPAQVHRVIAFDHAKISTWIITEENLRQEYIRLLDSLAPVHPLVVDEATMPVLLETVALCLKFSEKKEEQLYSAILKESCNTLVALVISQYLGIAKPVETHTRFEVISREFKAALEGRFKIVKDPAAYAGLLNISMSYLNECVKAVTGKSVTSQIQQRVTLEAKRLLYHSDRSVKEIAGDLGFDDHSYFTRLFTKVVGMTPLAFRAKNRV
jgi:AraC-like DNA-binding protein